jgi:hypothetical protein
MLVGAGPDIDRESARGYVTGPVREEFPEEAKELEIGPPDIR